MIMAVPEWLNQTEYSVCFPKTRGTKMMTEVRVEASTAVRTSRVPLRAAWIGSFPFSCCWEMDSMTTTALSTSIPVESIKPIIDSTFKVLPSR